MPVRRTPIRRTHEYVITTDSGEDIVFTIRNPTVADVISESNHGSMLEYVLGENNRVVATRREMRFGDMQMDRVVSRLVSWNLVDEQGNPIPVTRENIETYLTPEEFRLLAEHIAESGE